MFKGDLFEVPVFWAILWTAILPTGDFQLAADESVADGAGAAKILIDDDIFAAVIIPPDDDPGAAVHLFNDLEFIRDKLNILA